MLQQSKDHSRDGGESWREGAGTTGAWRLRPCSESSALLVVRETICLPLSNPNAMRQAMDMMQFLLGAHHRRDLYHRRDLFWFVVVSLVQHNISLHTKC